MLKELQLGILELVACSSRSVAAVLAEARAREVAAA
jgi:hypothetical protein